MCYGQMRALTDHGSEESEVVLGLALNLLFYVKCGFLFMYLFIFVLGVRWNTITKHFQEDPAREMEVILAFGKQFGCISY